MQIKITISYYHTPIRMAKIKIVTLNAGEDAEKQNDFYISGGNINGV